MAARLINRQLQIPNGMKFYIPGIPNWRSPRGSFQGIVDAAIRVLKANPAVAAKLGWNLDPVAMADRVDEFNARICASQGWNEYISHEDAPTVPKPMPHDQKRILQNLKDAAVQSKELVRGAKTLIEWRASGEPPVSQEQANKRAAVCAVCPLNDPQDWTAWFTKPAAELIKRQVEEIQGLKLTTPFDDKLHCCTACHCPLRVKVWPGIEWLVKRLSPEQTARLRQAPNCWILSESQPKPCGCSSGCGQR